MLMKTYMYTVFEKRPPPLFLQELNATSTDFNKFGMQHHEETCCKYF